MAARAVDIFAVLSTMFHLHAARRTGSDGGAVGDPLHVGQADGLTCLQKLQVSVDAAFVVTAVGLRAWTFPLFLNTASRTGRSCSGQLYIWCTLHTGWRSPSSPHSFCTEGTYVGNSAGRYRKEEHLKSVHLILL